MKKMFSIAMMFMKRWYNFSTIFLLVFSFASLIQTKSPDAEFSYYIDPYQNPQLSNQIFSTFNCGIFSHQDFFYRHQNYVRAKLSTCLILDCKGQYFIIQPEDVNLIEKICADNPHKSLDALRASLARNPAINDFQNLLPHQNKSEFSGFSPDIFIDKNHFESVANSEQRIKNLKNGARVALADRHASEKKNLENQYKSEKHAARNKSASEKNKIKNRQEKELAELKKKHEEENKYPLGKKNIPVKNSTGTLQSIQSQVPATAPCNQKQVVSTVSVSKIAPQELQVLYNQTQSMAIHGQNAQSCSFDKVMHNRSQQLQASLSNVVPVTQQMKINPQTMGFLQAHGIDFIQFQQVEGLAIQHQVTHELIDILDAVANYAQQHYHEIYQADLMKYCAYLASMTQESNIDGVMTEALQGANCCHGLYHFMNGLVENGVHQYHEMTTALQYFNPVLDYGAAMARGVINGATKAIAGVAVVAAGLALAPVATTAALQVALVATAIHLAPLCAQVSINSYDFGRSCIAGDWENVDKYLDASYKYITDLENVEKAVEIATGLVVAYNGAAIVRGLQSLATVRQVVATVYQSSGQVTQSVSLMTAAQLEQEIIASAEILQTPDFANFNMHHKNILGCDFFTIAPQAHPALARILEIAGMPGVINAAEQELIMQNCLTLSQVSLSNNLVAASVCQAAQEHIGKAVTCLRKIVIDLVRKGVGLDHLSVQDLELIAKTMKPGKNFKSKNCDLSNINIKFSKNSNHIFDNRDGHRSDSPEFRAFVINFIKNIENHVGPDVRDNEWFQEILSDGTQLWAQVRGDIIINCGINNEFRQYNCITGLSNVSKK